MLDNVILYHGGIDIVENPDLEKCKRGKDFGRGFYLTTSKSQAVKFAKLVALRAGVQTGRLNTYMTNNLNGLEVFEFKDTNKDWLNCVVGNRDSRYKSLSKPWERYDVLIGKIADDDTAQVINAYMAGAYGVIGSQKAIDFAVSMFKPGKLKDQICFRSKESLKRIFFVSSEEVEL